MTRHAPPGFEPHKVISRVDGYICDPENPDRVPTRIAAMIRAARFGGDSVRDIRDRMVARQRAHDRKRKGQRAIEARMMMVRHDG